MAIDDPLLRRDLPAKMPRPWVRGDPLTARHLNEGVRAIRGLYGGVPRPRDVTPDTGSDTEAGQAQGAAVEYVVVAAYGDFVVCTPLSPVAVSGAVPENETMIAKPYQLRRTPFDGSSRDGISYAYTSDVARTATDADDATESQVIVPSYVAGDRIYAVVVSAGVGVTQGDGVAVTLEWLDLNADARAWAKV